MSKPRGGLSWLDGVSWGLALALPFAVSLAVLRTILDNTLRANVRVSSAVNYIGGGICGLVSAVITVGVLTLSAGMLRMGTEFMGHAPVQYASNGIMSRGGLSPVPLDKITAGVYSWWSRRAFSSDQPLAKWHPDFHEFGGVNRTNYSDGKSRNTLRPGEATLLGRFALSSRLNESITDRWNSGPQSIAGTDGQNYDPGSRIEGFLVEFGRAGGEASGKVVVGPAQARLVVENQDGSKSLALHPIAVSSQAESASPVFARWRFDAQNVYVSSVGAADKALFAFEFVIPPNYQPVGLYIRGTRLRVDPAKKPDVTFPNAFARDAAINNLPALLKGGASAALTLNTGKAFVIKHDGKGNIDGFRLGNNTVRTLQKGLLGPDLKIDDDTNVIQTGTMTMTIKELTGTGSLEKPLRVSTFAVPQDTVMVQVEVGVSMLTGGSSEGSNPFSLIGPVMAKAERNLPAILADTSGNIYTPVGYWYQDAELMELRYTPDDTISSLSDLKSLSRTDPDKKMVLYFHVSKGAKIQHFGAGENIAVSFDPPLNTVN
jgi:hypothetical protein